MYHALICFNLFSLIYVIKPLYKCIFFRCNTPCFELLKDYKMYLWWQFLCQHLAKIHFIFYCLEDNSKQNEIHLQWYAYHIVSHSIQSQCSYMIPLCRPVSTCKLWTEQITVSYSICPNFESIWLIFCIFDNFILFSWIITWISMHITKWKYLKKNHINLRTFRFRGWGIFVTFFLLQKAMVLSGSQLNTWKYEPWHVISSLWHFDKCRLRQACAAPFKLRNSKWCSISSLTLIEYSSD